MTRRAIIKLGVFLLAGAIVNVAIAWIGALFTTIGPFAKTSSDSDVQWWSHLGPSGVNHPLTALDTFEGTLLRVVLMVWQDRGAQSHQNWTANVAVCYQAGWPCSSMRGENWILDMPYAGYLGDESVAVARLPSG